MLFPVEGVLHLGAICVAISLAYAGLDKIHREETDLEQELIEVKKRVEALLARVDATPQNGKLVFVFDIPQVYILCHVAGVNVKHGWKRFWRVVHRQLHVPLLGYFRSRFDRPVVAIISFLSTMIFLFLVGGTIFEPIHVSVGVAQVAFFWYAASLIWIILTAGASFKLRKIGEVCKSLELAVNQRIEVLLNLKIAAALQQVAGQGNMPGPPAPPPPAASTPPPPPPPAARTNS